MEALLVPVRNLCRLRAFREACEAVEGGRSRQLHRSSPDSLVPLYTVCMHFLRPQLYLGELREIFGDVPMLRPENGPPSSPFLPLARRLVQMMEEDGVQFPAVFYDKLISGLAVNRHSGVILNIAMKMELRGVQPSNYFYNRMIDILMRSGMSDRAMTVYERMVSAGTATVYTHCTLLNCHVEAGRMDRAEELWQRVIEGGYGQRSAIPQFAWNCLLKLRLAQNRFEEAMRLVKHEMSAPDHITCRILMHHFLDNKRSLPNESEILRIVREEFPKFVLQKDLSPYMHLVTEYEAMLESGNAFEDFDGDAGCEDAQVLSKQDTSPSYPFSMADKANLIRFYSRFDPKSAYEMIQRLSPEELLHSEIHNGILSMAVSFRVMSEWRPVLLRAALARLGTEQAVALANPDLDSQDGIVTLMRGELPAELGAFLAFVERSNRMTSLTVDIFFRRLLSFQQWTLMTQVYERLADAHHSTNMKRDTLFPALSIFQFYRLSDNHTNFYLTALMRSNRLADATDLLQRLTLRARRFYLAERNFSIARDVGLKLPADFRVRSPQRSTVNDAKPQPANGQGPALNHERSAVDPATQYMSPRRFSRPSNANDTNQGHASRFEGQGQQRAAHQYGSDYNNPRSQPSSNNDDNDFDRY